MASGRYARVPMLFGQTICLPTLPELYTFLPPICSAPPHETPDDSQRLCSDLHFQISRNVSFGMQHIAINLDYLVPL
ncbi:MAG: hypothetical protein KDB01_05665 [Planctomycetaceae bacterium]|nr:hypothetical protein [Planctomycetaceae bacterium]